MAANTVSTWASYLFEMQGRLQAVYATDHPWLAELSGVGDSKKVGRFTRDMDTNRAVFSGSKVRHTIVPYGMQAGGFVAETGTWNAPIATENDTAELNLKRFVQPFSITVDVERDSLNHSNAKAVAQLVKMAREAVARNENIAFLNGSSGLIARVANNTGSPALDMDVEDANFDVLLPGMVVDVLTESNGADPGQGKRRRIASVTETTATTGNVVFSTAAQASDGGSGSITFANTEAIYLTGSYGIAAQGLNEASAITGTFEAIDKAANVFWQGTDGRGGDTDVLPLSDSMLDGAVRRGRRYGLGVWDFGIGDPAAIDLYKQSKLSLVHYSPEESTIKSGFKGIVYDGADKPFPLIKEPAHVKGKLHIVRKSDFQLYGDEAGPAFLQDDGSMWRRFSRTLEKEADLLDRVQLGVTSCNSIVFLDDLAVA